MSDEATGNPSGNETAPNGLSDEAMAQFLRAYDEHRVLDQTKWYRKTAHEYERSSRQIALVSEVAILAASICGIVTMVWSDWAVGLGITAAALAALSAAVTAWADVVGFTTNADLYRTAYSALGRLRPDRPSSGADQDEVNDYVDSAEDIMLKEVRSWTAEWQMVDGQANAGDDVATADSTAPDQSDAADPGE